MSSAYEERPDVLAYRVRDQGVDIRELKEWRREVDGERSARTVEFKDLHDDMVELKSMVMKALWTLVGLIVTIAASAAAIVLTLAGGPH